MPDDTGLPPAVSVANLAKRFGAFTAVDGITFSIRAGEVFGFLGPNGAGKSTTIRMLCGLLRPTSGSALVLGRDAARQSRELRSSIGYMSQQFSLYGDLTVLENLEFFGGVYGLDEARLSERCEWALGLTGLGGRRRTATRDLARGHKQDLALGCALLHEPRLVFLDEPTAGVDPGTRTRMWGIVRELAAAGVTFLVSTHHMDEAERCDRLAMIYRGRLVALDTPGAIRRSSVTFSILRIEVSPLVEAVQALERSPLCRETALFGNAVHAYVDSAPEAARSLAGLLSAQGFAVSSISPVAPTLEDAFIALIHQEDRRGSAVR